MHYRQSARKCFLYPAPCNRRYRFSPPRNHFSRPIQASLLQDQGLVQYSSRPFPGTIPVGLSGRIETPTLPYPLEIHQGRESVLPTEPFGLSPDSVTTEYSP